MPPQASFFGCAVSQLSFLSVPNTGLVKLILIWAHVWLAMTSSVRLMD